MVQETRVYLGTTKDGFKVYDRADSHIHAEGGLSKEYIRRALKGIYANNSSFKKKEFRFNNPIGLNHCVPVSATDKIVMVYRKGREGQTPMVKGRKPLPCNILTVIIRKKKEEKDYTLLTAFIGGGSTREPWDRGIRSEEERKECEEFWKTHALIYDPKLIDWERM